MVKSSRSSVNWEDQRGKNVLFRRQADCQFSSRTFRVVRICFVFLYHSRTALELPDYFSAHSDTRGGNHRGGMDAQQEEIRQKY